MLLTRGVKVKEKMTKFISSVLCLIVTLQSHCRAGDKMGYFREYEMKKVEDWKTTNAQNSTSVIFLCAKHLFSTTVFGILLNYSVFSLIRYFLVHVYGGILLSLNTRYLMKHNKESLNVILKRMPFVNIARYNTLKNPRCLMPYLYPIYIGT